jgi:hypothetical protein
LVEAALGIFGPSREERDALTAQALAPSGFRLANERARELVAWTPLVLHATPETYSAAAFGRIEDAEVGVFDYGYSSTDAEGRTHSHDQLVVVAQYPRIEGGAAFSPDLREWSQVALVLDALLWIPPFTFLKVFQWLSAEQHPDRTVGHGEFDRLYRVRAPSDAAAQRAIPPRLRDTCVRLALQGTVELRPGAVLYSVRGCGFDAEGVVRALGYAAPLMVAATMEPSGYR